MSDIKITKITIALGKIEAEMTPHEARRLLNELKALFGDEGPRVIDRPAPYPVPARPIIIEQPPPNPRRDDPWRPYPNRPWITCKSDGQLRIDMNATA